MSNAIIAAALLASVSGEVALGPIGIVGNAKNSSSGTVNTVTGLGAGDTLVVIGTHQTNTVSRPSGFTEIMTVNTGAIHYSISFLKLASSSYASNVTVGGAGTSICFAVENLTGFSNGGVGADSSFDPPSHNVVNAPAILVAVGMATGGAYNTMESFIYGPTLTYDGEGYYMTFIEEYGGDGQDLLVAKYFAIQNGFDGPYDPGVYNGSAFGANYACATFSLY